MADLLEAPVWEAPARPIGDDLTRVGTLDPQRWVVAETHQTPPEIMKRDLPQRIHALVAMHGTPLLVLDRARLVQEYRAFRRLLPRVRLYYAVKANPHPDVIRTFAEMGGCFDVASEGEMRHVLACGVPADRMIFAN